MKARQEIERRSRHVNNGRQPSWDGRTSSQYDQTFLGKEETWCQNSDRRALYQKGDEIMRRIANGGGGKGGGRGEGARGGSTYSHKARASYQQGEFSPTGVAYHTTEPKGSQATSSGPSAIDLFDQYGLVPSAADGVEGLVGESHRAQANQESTGGGSGILVDQVGRKAANTGHPLAPTLQAARPPIVPGGSQDRGGKGRARDPRRHEARVVRNAAKNKSDAINDQSRSPTVRGHMAAPPKNAQQLLASSGREARDSNNAGRKRQGVGNPVESIHRGLYRGRSNATLRETQAPAQAHRVRRRWNVGGESAAASLVPSPPRDGRKEDAPVSDQRLVTAKVRLHKSKDLSALKSEHMEALSTLQDISCPPSNSAARSPKAQKTGDGVATLGTRGAFHLGGSSATASPYQAFITESSSLSPAESKVELVDNKLSADLPQIGSEEQAALRLMYRKWWMKIANGGSPPSPLFTPNPLEVSRIRRRAAAAADNAKRDVGGVDTRRDVSRVDTRWNVAVDTKRDAGKHRGARPPVSKQSPPRQPWGANTAKKRVVAKAAGVSSPKKQPPSGVSTGTTRSRSLAREKHSTRAAATAFVALQVALGTAAVLKAKSRKNAAAVKSCRGQRTLSKVPHPKNATTKIPKPPASLPRSRIDRNTSVSSISGTSRSFPAAPRATISASKAYKLQQLRRGDVPLNVARVHGDNETAEETGAPQPGVRPDSDVESVSENNDITEEEEEEGHDGRIFLADGRFISTRRTSSDANGDGISSDDRVGGGDEVAVGRSVVSDEVVADSVAEDESLDYADDSFEK